MASLWSHFGVLLKLGVSSWAVVRTTSESDYVESDPEQNLELCFELSCVSWSLVRPFKWCPVSSSIWAGILERPMCFEMGWSLWAMFGPFQGPFLMHFVAFLDHSWVMLGLGGASWSPLASFGAILASTSDFDAIFNQIREKNYSILAPILRLFCVCWRILGQFLYYAIFSSILGGIFEGPMWTKCSK